MMHWERFGEQQTANVIGLHSFVQFVQDAILQVKYTGLVWCE